MERGGSLFVRFLEDENAQMKVFIVVVLAVLFSGIYFFNFIGASTNVSSCQTLSVAGETYVLTNNVSSNGTCFTISAANITLDCAGYAINYSINGSPSNYGIYTNQFNTTINNCTVLDGNTSNVNDNRYGIYIDGSSSNSTIENSFVNVTNSTAIYVYGGSTLNYGFFINNTVYNYNNGAFYIRKFENALIQNNYFESIYGPALTFYSAANGTVINNIFNSSSTSDTVSFLFTSTYNNFTNNSVYALEENAFGLYSSNNYFGDNFWFGNTTQGVGVLISEANNNTFVQDWTEGQYAVYFFVNSTNNTFIDMKAINGSPYDVYYWFQYTSTNNTFLNCSYDSETVTGNGSYLVRKWYYQANVSNSSGSPLNGAKINAYNSSGVSQFGVLTNSSGYIDRQALTQYVNNGTKQYYTNYTINASLWGYTTGSNTINLTTNNFGDVFTLNAAPAFTGLGSGTSGDPYQITSWAQLSEVNDYLSSYFILMNDLNSSTTGYDTYASSSANGGSGWIPLGDYATSSSNSFVGSFDGQNYTISDLYINRTAYYQGLFGYLGSGAEIHNLGILNVNFSTMSYVGAVAGYSSSSVNVFEVFSNGTIYMTNSYGGGLIGYVSLGTISDSYSKVNVSGSIVGGLIGRAAYSPTINKTYSIGNVASGSYGGGLIGYGAAACTNCVYDTNTSGQSDTNGGSVPKTTEEMMSIETYENWSIVAVSQEADGHANHLYTWNIVNGSSYPFLSWEYTEGVIDTTPPTFTYIPSSAILTYGSETLGVNFSATDEISFSGFSVNDSNFTINSTGWLTNATILSVGDYNLNITISDSSGNQNSTDYLVTVNQANPSASLTNSTVLSVIYPTSFTVGYSESNFGDGDVSYFIYRNGTSVGTGETVTLGVGTYGYVLNTTGGTNYTSNSSLDSFILSVTQNSTNLSLSGTSLIPYGTAANVTGLGCPSQLTCNLYRNDTLVSNPDISTLSVGTYHYIYNTTGNANYTSDSVDFNLTVSSDVTAPTVTIVSPNSGSTYTSSSVSLSLVTNENSTCNYSTNSWSTNYSMTANSTGTGHTATASLSSGSYNITFSCADIVGNRNSTQNVSITVSITTSSGSSGSSGSSSSSSSITTTTTTTNDSGIYSPTLDQLSLGYNVSATVSEIIQIPLSTGTKEIIVNDVSGGIITISVDGQSYSFVDSLGLDLNNDSVYDIEIVNNGVFDNYADLSFTLISEEDSSISNTSEEKNKFSINWPNVDWSNWKTYVGIGGFVLILAGVLWWVLFRRGIDKFSLENVDDYDYK